MKVSDDLTALVFELQRARSPADKARALARAWRTVRGLNATERRLLVREVGFDGAEELVEGIAGKSGGAFAPAAVLEALGKMRKEGSISLRGMLAGLVDPETREDLLVRGIDLAADSIDPEEEAAESVEMEEPVVYDIPTAQPIDEVVERIPDPEPIEVHDATAGSSVGTAEPEPRLVPPPPPPGVEPRRTPEIAPEPEPPPRTEDPSPWDEPWQDLPTSESADPPETGRDRGFEGPGNADPREAAGSVLDRLRLVRNAIPDLRNAGSREIRETLEMLPELWARRRAVVDLIDAGIPAGVDATLDLVEELDRPLDRRWCLSALARRGDLEGDELERALAMLESPAARRRVEALAGRSR